LQAISVAPATILQQSFKVPRIQLTNDQKRELFRQYASGVTTRALVAQFGMTWATLQAIILKAGIDKEFPPSEEEIDFILQEGAYAPEPKQQINPFGDSTEIAAISMTMTEKVNALLEAVKNATTAEGIVNALTATLSIRQLMEMIANPPPVENWSDAARVVKILRDTFNMNAPKNAGNAKGIDYAMVNARPAKGTVLDI
jgi:hypothetical protein